MRAILLRQTGGPEELKVEEVDLPNPADGEVLLRHTAVAVNFADIYIRQGIYFFKPDLPVIPGLEGVGVVEAVGPNVTGFKVGQHVAYVGSIGAYAEARIINADQLFAIPEGLDDKLVAAAMLRGLTAQYLVNQTYQVKSDDTVLVHSAAGGMGTLLTQWAKHLGARVIGTVSTPAKAKIAEDNGCDLVINTSNQEFPEIVLDFTQNNGVQVVYDAVGKDTFDGNLDVLAIRGIFVNYGAASGPLPPIDATRINAKSLYFTKSSLIHYTQTPEVKSAMVEEVFRLIGERVLNPGVDCIYPLEEVARAHADMAARKTTGSVLLIP